MKTGDLVVAIYDEQRGLTCVGVVLQSRPIDYQGSRIAEVNVLWSSESNPVGWWRSDQLRVISSVS